MTTPREPPPIVEGATLAGIGRRGHCAGCNVDSGLAVYFNATAALLCLRCVGRAQAVVERHATLSADRAVAVLLGMAARVARWSRGGHAISFGSLVRDLVMSWAAEVERTTGLEPATSGLGSRRSTDRAASAEVEPPVRAMAEIGGVCAFCRRPVAEHECPA